MWLTCVCPRAPGSGLYCETSIDGIGTCWPRSAAGHMVSRPCPEMFYGVRYNTTSKCDAGGSCQREQWIQNKI